MVRDFRLEISVIQLHCKHRPKPQISFKTSSPCTILVARCWSVFLVEGFVAILECKLQTNEPNILLNIVIKFGINLRDESGLDQVDLTPSWLNRLRCLRPPYFISSLCLPPLSPLSLSLPLRSTFTMKYWWNSNLSLTRPCSPLPPLLSLSASSVIQFQIGYLPLPHPEPICASPRPSVSHASLTPSASPRLPLMSFVFLSSSFYPTTQKTSLICGCSRCTVMELLMQGITQQGDYISICS